MPAGCLVLTLRMDRTTAATTALTLAGVTTALGLAAYETGPCTALAAAIPIATVLIAAFMIVPRYAVVQGDELLLVAPARTVELKIQRVLGTTDLTLRHAHRLHGIGGFLGYVGTYKVKGIGKCKVYSRRRKRLTVLETPEGTVLVGIDPEALGGATA